MPVYVVHFATITAEEWTAEVIADNEQAARNEVELDPPAQSLRTFVYGYDPSVEVINVEELLGE